MLSGNGEKDCTQQNRIKRAEARLVRSILVTQPGILPESLQAGKVSDRDVNASQSLNSTDISTDDSKPSPLRLWTPLFATSSSPRHRGHHQDSTDDTSGIQNHMKGLYNDKSIQNSANRSNGRIHMETAENCFVIRPDKALKTIWDLYILFLLLYVALISVYVYSFLGILGPNSVWFWIERVLDVSFFADIVLLLFTAYEKPNGTYEVDRKKIRHRYFRKWFAVDLIATVPWDIVALGVYKDSTEPGPNVLLLPRYIRLLRLAKLFHIVKLLRTNNKFKDLEMKLGIKFAYLRLAGLFATIVLVSHWFACLFYYLGFITNGVCVAGESCQYPTWFLKDPGDIPPDNFGRYIASLYFSVYTITTIGYGDVVPETTVERSYTIAIMLGGAVMFAYIISQVSDIQNDLKESSVYYRKQMDRLTDLAKSRHIPLDLQREIREDFEREHRRQRVVDEKNLFENIKSDELRFRVLEHIYGEHVKKSRLLKYISSVQLSELYQHMEEKQAKEDEVLFKKGDVPTNFYVVQSGTVAVRIGNQEQELKENEYFGDGGLFFGRPRDHSAICLESTKLIVVPREAVMKTLKSNETALKRVKKEEAMELWSRVIRLMEGEMRFAKMARLLRESGENYMISKGIAIPRRTERARGLDRRLKYSASERVTRAKSEQDGKFMLSPPRLSLPNQTGRSVREENVMDPELSESGSGTDETQETGEARESESEEELRRQFVNKCNKVREIQGKLNELQSVLTNMCGQFGDVANSLNEIVSQ